VRLTPAGRAANKTTPINFIMKDTSASPTKRKRKKKTRSSPKRSAGATVKTSTATKTKRTMAASASPIEDALRGWRLQEARRRGVPAFRLFSNQTLRAIAQRRPAKAAELIALPGIGMSAVEKYGQHIYRICQTSGEGHA
jgi:DNA topoisomerase III